MALLESSSHRPIREEIVDLAANLAESQARLHQLAARLEENESESWESRYENLQNSYKEAVNSAKWLRAQNADLEHKVAQHRPEMDNALSAREGAFRKLGHARKVIRDLLEERRDMSSPRSKGSLTQEEIDQALFDEFHRDDSDSSSSSSGSQKTVRLGANSSSPSHVQVKPITSPGPSTQRSAQLSPLLPASVTSRGNILRDDRSESEYSSAPSEQLESSQSLIIQALSPRQSPTSSRGSPETWRIHFKKPPGTSIIQEGPITLTRLQNSLNLDDDTMNSLQSLATSPDLSMRLQITLLRRKMTVVFLYDPILVEYRGKSYILDWGRRQTNQNIERYISTTVRAAEPTPMDSAFHTFLFPTSENSWFYVGAFQWSIVQLKDFWPLEGNDKVVEEVEQTDSR
ncbi:hypothetical protein BDZ97DRAFT_246874 [Flammula alnicola]|nr:hypothetical protein BDZ97DRAFT_246874 [Flammula alnicola]